VFEKYFRVRTLPLGADLQLKFEVEKQLQKTSPAKHYQLLHSVRLSAICDPKSIAPISGRSLSRVIYKDLAYKRSVPLLLTSLSGDSGGGWGDKNRDVEVNLAVLWHDTESINAVVQILDGWKIPLVKLNRGAPLEQQVRRIVEALTRDTTVSPIRMRPESITRSHRGLILSPDVTGGTFTTWQQFAQQVLGQELGISTVIELRGPESPGEEVKHLYETGRFDWVAFCPAREPQNSVSGRYTGNGRLTDWLPYLALEYDGAKPVDEANFNAKNSICQDAGLTLVRCSYKDFKDAGEVDEDFQREFAHYVLRTIRPTEFVREDNKREVEDVQQQIERIERSLRGQRSALDDKTLRMKALQKYLELRYENDDAYVSDWRSERWEALRVVEDFEGRKVDLRIRREDEYIWGELFAKPMRSTGSWKELCHSPKMKMAVFSPSEQIFGEAHAEEFLERWLLRNYLRGHFPKEDISI